MKNLNEKRVCIKAALMLGSAAALSLNTFAAAPDFARVVAPVVELLNSLTGPMLAIVGAVGMLYSVLLGVKYAKAEEPQEREKAKSHLKNALIGFVLIFVLILALNLLVPVLSEWVNDYAKSSNDINHALIGTTTEAESGN